MEKFKNSEKGNVDLDAIAGCLGIWILVIGVIITLTIVNAFVVNRLWSWFIVTTFGMQPLSLAQAAGLSLFVTYFMPTPDTSDGNTKKQVLTYIVRLLLVLIVGHVIYLFL